MKVRLIDKEPAEKEWQYPWIGKIGNFVVLFSEEDCGTVLVPDGCRELGYYNNSWTMENFTPITDKDILIET